MDTLTEYELGSIKQHCFPIFFKQINVLHFHFFSLIRGNKTEKNAIKRMDLAQHETVNLLMFRGKAVNYGMQDSN